MIKSDGLREFVAVVENGGFSSAAKILDVSTSFVSRQVNRLEERLEMRLLNRTTRTVRLTEIGKTYYERSRKILDQLEALDSEMTELQEKPKGLIRITAAGEYAEHYVAPAIAKFVSNYPDVSVELNATMQVVDIIKEGFDIAIRASALTDSSLIARKIEKRRIMICASPKYLKEHGRPKKPEDLRFHNCLLFPDMAWRFRCSDRIQEIKVRGNWHSNNGRVLVAAAREGHGLIRLSEYYVEEYIRSGELEVVLQDYEVDDVATWLIYPNRHHLPTRIRILVEFLLEELPGKTLI